MSIEKRLNNVAKAYNLVFYLHEYNDACEIELLGCGVSAVFACESVRDLTRLLSRPMLHFGIHNKKHNAGRFFERVEAFTFAAGLELCMSEPTVA